MRAEKSLHVLERVEAFNVGTIRVSHKVVYATTNRKNVKSNSHTGNTRSSDIHVGTPFPLRAAVAFNLAAFNAKALNDAQRLTAIATHDIYRTGRQPDGKTIGYMLVPYQLIAHRAYFLAIGLGGWQLQNFIVFQLMAYELGRQQMDSHHCHDLLQPFKLEAASAQVESEPPKYAFKYLALATYVQIVGLQELDKPIYVQI